MPIIYDVERDTKRPAKQGRCADCIWCYGALKDRCDHPQVRTIDPVPCLNARKQKSPCGPAGTLWSAGS